MASRPFWNERERRRRLEDFTLFIVAAPFSNCGRLPWLPGDAHEQGEVDFTSGVTVDMGAVSPCGSIRSTSRARASAGWAT